MQNSEELREDKWFVYMLECADGSLYTGITTDCQRRLKEHNNNDKKGAKYTRARRPVSLIWHEAHTGRAAASRREFAIKRLTRPQKFKLIGI